MAPLTADRIGRRGSIIAAQYASGERVVKVCSAPIRGESLSQSHFTSDQQSTTRAQDEVGSVDIYPANEEIAKAVQQKVAVSVAYCWRMGCSLVFGPEKTSTKLTTSPLVPDARRLPLKWPESTGMWDGMPPSWQPT
jgi:hypothetical protein